MTKVKKHDLLKLDHLIEATMLSRGIKGLFAYCKFKQDIKKNPSNPREEVWASH